MAIVSGGVQTLRVELSFYPREHSGDDLFLLRFVMRLVIKTIPALVSDGNWHLERE